MFAGEHEMPKGARPLPRDIRKARATITMTYMNTNVATHGRSARDYGFV